MDEITRQPARKLQRILLIPAFLRALWHATLVEYAKCSMTSPLH